MTGKKGTRQGDTSLRRIHCLSTASAEQLTALTQIAARRQLAAGDSLFHQGAPCREVFAVLHGALKLYRDGGAGQETVLELVAPGALLGEHALVTDRHPCGAVALCDSHLLVFGVTQLDGVLEQHPDIDRALMVQLYERNVALMDRVRRQARFSALQLVASFLLDHSARDGTLTQEAASCNRRDLSSLLTLRPETLSRVFSRLRRDGALRESPGGAQQVDRAALAALMSG